MFICQRCKESSKAGEKPTLSLMETRPRSYPDNSDRRGRIPEGFEIVKEEQICSGCAVEKEVELALSH